MFQIVLNLLYKKFNTFINIYLFSIGWSIGSHYLNIDAPGSENLFYSLGCLV